MYVHRGFFPFICNQKFPKFQNKGTAVNGTEISFKISRKSQNCYISKFSGMQTIRSHISAILKGK